MSARAVFNKISVFESNEWLSNDTYKNRAKKAVSELMNSEHETQ